MAWITHPVSHLCRKIYFVPEPGCFVMEPYQLAPDTVREYFKGVGFRKVPVKVDLSKGNTRIAGADVHPDIGRVNVESALFFGEIEVKPIVRFIPGVKVCCEIKTVNNNCTSYLMKICLSRPCIRYRYGISIILS